MVESDVEGLTAKSFVEVAMEVSTTVRTLGKEVVVRERGETVGAS